MKQPLYRFRLEQQLLGLAIYAIHSKHSIEQIQSLACNILSYKSFTNWNESPFNTTLINYKIRYYNHSLLFKAIQDLNSKGIVADSLHIYDFLLENNENINPFETCNYLAELGNCCFPTQEPESMMLLFEKSLIDYYEERILNLIKTEQDIILRSEWHNIYEILLGKNLDILSFVDTLPVLLERVNLFDHFIIQEFQNKKKEIQNRCKIIADAVNRFNYSLRNIQIRSAETNQNFVSAVPENQISNELPPIAPF
jgi:hypothetical protein